ncbi:MAG TPA: phosphotransferase [Candidatus Limnocylindria bacterium]|jgi:hypothetical protein
MEREDRLEAARRVDWRFLLDDPHLDSVACLLPGDERLPDALAALGVEVSSGTAAELSGAERQWSVVVLDLRRSDAGNETLIATAVGLAKPGGWVLIDLPARARLLGHLARTERALRSTDLERTHRHWHMPSRKAATHIVSLDDPVAIRAALRRHGSSRRHRTRASAARRIASLAPPDLLGGDVTILARRAGGTKPASPWPGLGSVGSELAASSGLVRPSFILLTPRYPASAHVLLLIVADDGATRLVAKVARLREDGASLALEAEHLAALAASPIERGSIPELVTLDRVSGHAVLVESALRGRPLDRPLVRRNPGGWIMAARGWLEGMPTSDSGPDDDVGVIADEALDRIASAVTGNEPASDLVARAWQSMAPLRHQSLPRPFEHGDLSHPNILVLDGDRLGVIDWETATRHGVPLHDLCFFIGYVALSTGAPGEPPFEGLLRVLAHRDWGAVGALRGELDRLGVDRELMPALVLCCWTRSLARIMDRLGFVPEAEATSGSMRRDRYYAMWEGTVRGYEQLADVLS